LRSLFESLPNVKVVQSLSAGVDWLLPVAPQGVTVCAAVGVHDGPVSEWVVGAVLAMNRRLPEFIASQQRGEWNREAGEGDSSEDLDGRTVVIVGHGSIGRALALRLAPFGASVIGVARHARSDARPVSALPQLLPLADVVVDLLPLTAATERFVDRAFFASMRPGALFVNAGRGRTVDTGALLEALNSQRLRAALDVMDPEPLPDGHPLWRAPNCLITPHVAGSVPRWRIRSHRFAGEQVRRYVAGEPLAGVAERG